VARAASSTWTNDQTPCPRPAIGRRRRETSSPVEPLGLTRGVRGLRAGARVTGLAAGPHAIVRLWREVDGMELVQAAARHQVGVCPLGYAYLEVRSVHDGLALCYANLAESAIEEGIRRLARALEELPPVPAATNDGGAMSR
jgi:hypothetical protein